MKNQLVIVALAFSAAAFAQKKELKAANAFLQEKKYAKVEEQLKLAEPLMAEAKDKYKLDYYYLKAKAVYGNGKKNNPLPSTAAFKEVIDFEKKANLNKYSKESQDIISKIVQQVAGEGSKAYGEKKFKDASKNFELVYSLSATDTMFLENAALSCFFDKNYDHSIELYKKLLGMGYTGISTQYKGKSEVNGEWVFYASKKDLDNQVRMKIVNTPTVEVTPSRAGDIVKNIALSYIAKGDEKGALAAISDAKKLFPNDYTLVISEANIYFKLGDKGKFLEGLTQAISIKPEDPNLHYNVGVITLEQGFTERSIEHFKKAIELKPDYADAYNNIGAAILEKTKPIVEEMNKNLNNFKKYDALKVKQKGVYKEALPYYENAHKYSPKGVEVMKTLENLYEFLGMYDKQKEIKAKIDAI